MNPCRQNYSCMRNQAYVQPRNGMTNRTNEMRNSCGCSGRPDRKTLLQEINECSFAVNDMQLYLDTHPYDEKAYAYFMEHKNRRVAALKAYAKYYGPLTIDTADDEASESFLWAETPWPWEGGNC